MSILQFIKDFFNKIMHKNSHEIKSCARKLKVLSVIKYRQTYDSKDTYSHGGGMSSGLLNSAQMVVNMLNDLGINGEECEAKLAEVIDNNCIDKHVFAFKPDVVIIEAVWVVPEKFDVLVKLHPKVKWIIRNHSNIPFLAQEGQAMGWLEKYITHKNVYIASNTPGSVDDLKDLVTQTVTESQRRIAADKVVFFPNYYKSKVESVWQYREDADDIHISCFGAVRPLKNHLQQAFAAIRFARKLNKKLYFHINSGRLESGGEPIIRNLRNLFANSVDSVLIEEKWMPHDDFVRHIAKMDLSVQVSFSETFNIVSADAVMQGVPVVVSDEIFWVNREYHAIPTSTDSIVEKMEKAYFDSRLGDHDENKKGLHHYNSESHRSISNTIVDVVNSYDVFGN